jgi:outer membrane lipoprotein-sorting protein
MHIRLVPLVVAACAGFAQDPAQPSVDELVAKHIEALGGLENLKAVETMRMTGTAVLGGKMESPLTLLMKRPNSSRLELQYEGQTVVQGFDGTTGWMLLPMRGTGAEKATDEENAEMKESSDFDGPLVDYKAKGYKVESEGQEDVAGKHAWKLKVTRDSGHVESIYLDPTTYLPLKISMRRTPGGKAVEIERYPSDYRKTGSIVLPYTIEQKAEGRSVMVMKIDHIDVNVPLNDVLFQMPAK